MKWFKKHKEAIADGVKFSIMMDTMLFGFWWNYMCVLNLFGLLIVWWVIVIAMVLAFLSLFGFVQWCVKG